MVAAARERREVARLARGSVGTGSGLPNLSRDQVTTSPLASSSGDLHHTSQ